MSDNLVDAEAEYWEEKSRREVLLWGRRTGKTHATLHELGYTSETCPLCRAEQHDED